MGLLTRFRKETTVSDTTTTAAAWPEGVIARYLTVAGATVDIREGSYDATDQTGTCTGCGTSYTRGPALTREWAQVHAEKCRALSRPA
jgi:hypothetical protein